MFAPRFASIVSASSHGATRVAALVVIGAGLALGVGAPHLITVAKANDHRAASGLAFPPGDTVVVWGPVQFEGGNPGPIDLVTIVRDRETPVLTVTAPADGLVTGQNAAALSGTVSDRTAVTASDAAGNQAVVVRSIGRDPGMPGVAMSGGGAGFSCLDQGGPLVTLSGVQTQRYHNVTLADSTKIDARTAQWIDVAETQTMFATRIGGGVNLCWSGGEASDSFPPATSWFTMLNRYGHRVKPSSATDLEDMRIFNYGYGVLEDSGASNWTVRRTLVRYSRATCVNNEGQNSGTIEDSFLDGCFRAVGSDGPATLGDSSANLVVIRNSLIRLQVIDGSYFSEVPNHSAFWDWDVRAPRISLFDNVFRADARSREGQGNGKYMAPPPGKLAECSGNIMVWLGQGPFPETLPACFTVTTDVAVWDSAVAAWNAAHPPVLPDVSPPIVSMFQPGVVGDTILTGTVTVIATALDDRSVAGVQLEIDGQDIGEEQTSPTPYIGADSLLNRDFTTKYQIEWNSASVPNGTHALRARARDAAGHSTTSAAVSVTVSNAGGLPPDPGTVATPIDPTVAPRMAAMTEFLYTGANPIQTGVATGTINPIRAAVLRGKVLARDGSALPGVTITILGHVEYGQTLTRTDGRFDLALNGGGRFTVEYVKAGYLPAQRTVDVPWQDYALVDDVVLTAPDALVTTIDFSQPTQVARGSVVSDADGTRRATLLFSQGTQATMVLADGSTQPLSTLHVRATEFSTGANGLQAMAAELPPTSAYTYAVEYSVDEALAVGAREVQFSQPVASYVENFLQFPIGLAVPAGYYDRRQGRWVPAPNGRIVKILTITNGRADLDVTGIGQPSDAATLAALGVTDAERTALAQQYGPDQSFWRVPVTHFTVWDSNWPFSAGLDAEPPPADGPQFGISLNEPDCRRNSIIECQGQILREAISITGTPFSLNYKSSRSPGYAVGRTIQLRVSGPTIPPGVRRIVLRIDVAGRSIVDTFPAAPNQVAQFTWDGMDAYGRAVPGVAVATIRLGYLYRAVYTRPADFAQAFAMPSGVVIQGEGGGGGSTSDRLLRGPGDTTTQGILISRVFRERLGSWQPGATAGVGGWTLNVHHGYDPVDQVIHEGDGTQRSAGNLALVIQTVAGNAGGGCISCDLGEGVPAQQAILGNPVGVAVAPDGSLYISDRLWGRVRRVGVNGLMTTVAGSGNSGGYGGDNGPATMALLSSPSGIALAPDGSLYIADLSNQRVRRVFHDTITTVAGTGTFVFNGDDRLATTANLFNPVAVASGPDGSLYIVDQGHHRIRRVDPSGMIQTIAGDGTQCSLGGLPQSDFGAVCGDSVPAREAKLRFPTGVAIGPDGSLFIADGLNNRIRRVGLDGILTTVAGDGGPPGTGDGGPAIEAGLSLPNAIAVDAAGAIYISEGTGSSQDSTDRVRRIGVDGIITTVAGRGMAGFEGDGGPSPQALLKHPQGLAVAPDGTLRVADMNNHRVRTVMPAFPGVVLGDVVLASSDGVELYEFDEFGRHQRTLSPLTQATLYTFAYDTSGRLFRVTNASGDTTTIERDAAGVPIAISAPYGQRSTVSVTLEGYLDSITNPAGESFAPDYASQGLLSGLVDPRGYASAFGYDSLGRLVSDSNAAGGVVRLENVRADSVTEVTFQSALARTTTYRVERTSAGLTRRVTTDPAELTTTNEVDGAGRTTMRFPTGDSVMIAIRPDPRWGMQFMSIDSLMLRTPSGLRATVKERRQVTLSDPSDPLSITSQIDSVSLNGRWTVNTYSAGDRTFNTVTPAGRSSTGRLDSLGRVIEEATPGITPVQYQFDARGLLEQAEQGSRQWSFAYNAQGLLGTVTDPLTRSTQLFHDAGDRVFRQVLPDTQELLYAYDSSANLRSVTPPGRPAHGFRYDSINLVTAYDPPSLGAGTWSTTYQYDLDRNLTQVARPDGQTIAFGHDSAGRLDTVTVPGGAAQYTYDPTSGNLGGVTGPYGGSLGFTYDGSLLKGVTWAGEVAGTVTATYDNDLRTTEISVNGGSAIAFSYDDDGLLTQAGALTVTRDSANGLIVGTALGTVSTSRDHTVFAELEQLTANAGSSVLLDVGYVRDALGRITELTETIGAATTTRAYTYDLAGRLTEVRENTTLTAVHEYDANGNRTQLTTPGGVVTGTYDDQDRLLTYGTASYAYTRNGELSTKTVGSAVTQYGYDVLGNLRQVTTPDGTVIDYVVDGMNRRVGKKVNGVLVQGFLYQDLLNPVAELGGVGNVVSQFVYGTRANVPAYMIKGGITYRIVADHLGSVRLVVRATDGVVVQRMDYDEFGRVLSNTNPGFQPFGYAGGLYDTHTGFVRFGVRDYDATTGRWTAKDPLRFHAGVPNFYVYSGLDPINDIDPTGAQHEDNTHWASGTSMSDLVPRLQNALPTINRVVGEVLRPNYDAAWVVSTTGGSHNPGSVHGARRAIDLRIWHDPTYGKKNKLNATRREAAQGYISPYGARRLTEELQKQLGSNYLVRNERNWPDRQEVWKGPHIHIETRCIDP